MLIKSPLLLIGGPFNGEVWELEFDPQETKQLHLTPVANSKTYVYLLDKFSLGDNSDIFFLYYETLSLKKVIQLLLANYKPNRNW